jgi:hypothetical protein
MNTKQNDLLEQLTTLQRERYHSIYHRYNDLSLLIVTTKKIRGRNSFPSIIGNSNLVNNSTSPDREYRHGLTESFEVNKPASIQYLIQAVCAQRAQFNLPQFISNILEQCLDEVASVYYFEQGDYDISNHILKGIKPLVSLLVS